jgi:hypothetical protein
MCPANPVPSVEGGSPSGQPSPGPALADYLIPLISAMLAQTEAINRLASSNEALVRAMAEADGSGPEDAGAPMYLSGRPK